MVTSCLLAKNSYPSSTTCKNDIWSIQWMPSRLSKFRNVYDKKTFQTWWARQIKSRSSFRMESVTLSGPNVKETPLSFGPQPRMSLLGSDQRRSHSKPLSGTSVGRFMFLIWFKLSNSGESPPCMQSIFSSMRAATGRQLKHSENIFQSLILNLRLHSS